MRWGRLWREATALGISRVSKPWPPSSRTSSSIRVRFGLASTALSPSSLTLSRSGALLVLDVEAGGLQPPARHLGDQVGGVAQPLEGHLRHLLEELRGRGRAAGDEAIEAVTVEAVEQTVELGLTGGGPATLVAEEAHLAEGLPRAEPRQHLLDPPGHRLRDHDAAVPDQEQLLARIGRAEEHVPLLEPALAEARTQGEEDGLVHVLEQHDAAQEADLGETGHSGGPALEHDVLQGPRPLPIGDGRRAAQGEQ